MASRIPESVIDEVASRANIVEVVGDYVRLTRKGNRFWGLCPFHSEKSPSFTVNAQRNLYHCFGCGASGNTYGFLMRHDGLSFPEAVRRLAERVGVTIPEGEEDTEAAKVRREQRDEYFETTDLAQRYFRAALESGRWSAPTDYLRERGIDDATAEAFGIGYAPPEWSALVDALGRRGVASRTLEAAGLAQARRVGEGHVDRFRNRVMFPIVNLAKKVLAFSGRTLDAEERAKYVNSPETAFYTKGNELFGLHIAHRAIRNEGAAVLVEGNFDVVSLHARGLAHVCAPLGTALTARQARLVKRYTDRVVLLFDGDSAGRAAAEKALAQLLAADVPEVLIAALPDGSDPDDFVRQHGADALRKLIDDARPMLDASIDEAIRPAAGRADIAVKRAAADEVARLLSPVKNPMVRTAYINEAARRLELDPSLLDRHVARETEREPPPYEGPESEVQAPAVEVTPLDAHEATLVDVLAERPDLLEVVYREELHHVIPHAELAAFLERTAVEWTEQGGPSFRDAVDRVDDESLRGALTAALVVDRGISSDRIADVFDETLTSLKVRWIRREMRRVSEEVRATEDFDAQIQLMQRFEQLGRWLSDLQPSGPQEGDSAA